MSTEVREQIRGYIIDKLLEGDARGFSDDTDLLRTGILDSFSILEFTNFLQERFGSQISLEKVSGENFQNVNSITRMMQEELQASQET